MGIKNITRLQAFLRHLFISCFIAFATAAFVFLVWYPDELSNATGIKTIFLLLLMVDVCMGPLITLIIFNVKKKELKRDLLIVAILQFIALGYGLHTTFVARPAFIVFSVDRFDLITANDIQTQAIAKAKKTAFQSIPLFGPKLAFAKLPNDNKTRNELLQSSISGGADLPQLPEFYEVYENYSHEVLNHGLTVQELENNNPDSLGQIKDLVNRYRSQNIEFVYLPLRAKASDIVILVDKTNGHFLQYSNLKPWK